MRGLPAVILFIDRATSSPEVQNACSQALGHFRAAARIFRAEAEIAAAAEQAQGGGGLSAPKESAQEERSEIRVQPPAVTVGMPAVTVAEVQLATLPQDVTGGSAAVRAILAAHAGGGVSPYGGQEGSSTWSCFRRGGGHLGEVLSHKWRSWGGF